MINVGSIVKFKPEYLKNTPELSKRRFRVLSILANSQYYSRILTVERIDGDSTEHRFYERYLEQVSILDQMYADYLEMERENNDSGR